MTPTLGYALLALLCFGINDLLFKRASQKGAASHQLMTTLSLTMLPCLLVYGFLVRSITPTAAALWGTVAAIFTWVGFYNFSRSLKSGAVSIAAPTFRLAFVVTAVLAIAFFHETISATKVTGLLAAALAVWLLLGASAGARVEFSADAIPRLLIATVSVGVAFFLFKLALRQGATPPTVLVCQTIGLSLVSTIAALIIDRRVAASSTAIRYGIAFGVIQSVGFAALMEGLAAGEASVLVPIAQMSFVVTAIVGILFLGEALTARKTAGLAAAVGAITLLGVMA